MKLILFLSLLVVVVTLSHGSYWKVSPGLRNTMMSGKENIDILVMIDEINSVLAKVTSKYTKATTHGQKANSVHRALTDHAARTQESTLEFLSTKKSSNEIKSYWINNMIWVGGADHDLIIDLADRPEVTEILEDEIIYLNDEVVDMGEFPTNKQNMEWGIRTIRAPEAWQRTKGKGVIVGIIDSGAKVTHTMIKDSYMGNNASKFAWYNPYRSSDWEPNDGHGHGTHVTGTIVGTNGIGVAPEAKWISCKGIKDDGYANNADIIACMQFMACPHHHSGPTSGSDCSQAPHIVSNSWGGGLEDKAKDDAISTWHAANIWPVFAAGNSGPSCNTIVSPAKSVSGVISVGSTSESETIATTSSRGPVRQTEIYPHISAPGVEVRSAGIASDNAYTTKSGTSMACPHVAALMASYKSNLSYRDVKKHLEWATYTRIPVGPGETCEKETCGKSQWPNNSFGHGRIDAAEALDRISSKY